MLKKVYKVVFYILIMAMAVWAAEGFTEMILDEFIYQVFQSTYPDTILEFIFKEYDGIALYLTLEFALVFTTFKFGEKTLDIVRKEKRES